MRLLLVEDNRQLSDWIAMMLRRERFSVDCAYSGDDADHLLFTEEYALVILDLTLPVIDGFEVLRRLRTRGSTVPVLILSANDSLDGKVAGFNVGADDFLRKPFDFVELEARIRAHLRRSGAIKRSTVECGALAYDCDRREFSLAGAKLDLTAREHAVLEALVLRAGSTVRKSSLATSVFGFEDSANPSAIELYVHRVRKKLADSDVAIVTLRGLGYALRAPSAVH